MDGRYGVYRQIRAERTWRPLGKMTWWRIVAGIVLLLSVFLISGFFSQRLAAGGHFQAAKAMMVAPSWMERYKPDTKAYIEAGAFYQSGNYEEAYSAFSELEARLRDASDSDFLLSVSEMKSLSALKLASMMLQSGEEEAARGLLEKTDIDAISEQHAEELEELLRLLEEQGSAAE